MTALRITGGEVYDPINGVDGETRDLWIVDGRIASGLAESNVIPHKVLDVSGCIVMPGGIDMHCHVAGPKINVGRRMQPLETSSDAQTGSRFQSMQSSQGVLPSSFSIGHLYAGLGYTTAMDAAVAPIFARHVHQEFADVPILDKGFLALIGNNHFAMNCIREGNRDRLDQFCRWLLWATRGFGFKIVNPGGVENWKGNGRGNVAGLDDTVCHFNVTPRQILTEVASACDRIGLPHSVHIHANRLGVPGNAAVTLETMRALDGRRAHFAHVQFHSYSGYPDDVLSFGSGVRLLVDYVNAHKQITVDVGHIAFGPAVALTGDGPVGHFLHRATGSPWFSCEIEAETGCGVVPIEYRDKSLVHSVQWAVGLEWYLLMEDPWRIAMSTDFPNGGAFLAYPEMIALLMSKPLREKMLMRVHPAVRARTILGELDREYSLAEIAILTRAAPARILGLPDKGHLRQGAAGDVTIYSKSADLVEMFAMPRYVIKGGVVIFDDGEIRASPTGGTLHAGMENASRPDGLESWFDRNYSVRLDTYEMADEELVGATLTRYSQVS